MPHRPFGPLLSEPRITQIAQMGQDCRRTRARLIRLAGMTWGCAV